jgi:hypothetical protein
MIAGRMAAWGAVLVCALALAVPRAATAVSASDVSEYQVKGAYLFNFIRLIEWPDAPAVSTPTLPLCVLGESPVVAALDGMATAPVRGRRIVVRRITTIPDARACEVLFLSERASSDLDGVVRALPPGVLTVSEIDTDDRVGSVINFVVEDDRVGFDVNVQAASRAQLAVSARLLSVARAVDGRKRRRDQ